ncbi:AtzH-like domain-containing protein [Kineococcus gynurae]|uniref:AtzH-like domain-containing protein n=1 Tax=Kineococcus gynurae TaxID=452979 RepID=A0ABV5LRW9_9ACTN
MTDAELLRAAHEYENALRDNDLAALDTWFADGLATVRAEGGTALVGHGEISDYRARRGGAPVRHLRRVHVREPAPGHAVTVSETERVDGGSGLQTQVWERRGEGWRIIAAHVSGAPAAPVPTVAPGPDRATWRERGPDGGALVRGSGHGELAGVRVAVKDLVDLTGHRVGAGVPAHLERAVPATRTAPALRALLDAGADVTGIAQTDEFAFSLMGTNAHYGTPANVAAPGRTTGGSTSGPAAAVAVGAADLGIGTDTAGSLRVPGSFCGLYAWRPTHGAVDVEGVLPLAPSFDTVGLLAAEPAVLLRAGRILLGVPGTVERPRALLRSATLSGLAEPATAVAVDAALTALAVQTGLPLLDVVDLPGGEFGTEEVQAWTAAFRTVQAAEAWAAHGRFVEENPGAVSPAVEARFRTGAGTDPVDVDLARETLRRSASRLAALLAHGWLTLPSTAGPAPLLDASPAQWEAARASTLPLTSLASGAGVPVLGLPWGRVGELPVGLSVLAPAGADAGLLDLLTRVAPEGRRHRATEERPGQSAT